MQLVLLACPLGAGGQISTCINSGATGLSGKNPQSIAINRTLNVMYISLYNSGAINTCTINGDGSVSNCSLVKSIYL